MRENGKHLMRSTLGRLLLITIAVALASVAVVASASAEGVKITKKTYPGFVAPETPEKFDKVGVIKVAPASEKHTKNVLVLEPGTSAGAAYFVPFAKWLVENTKGWQVWSVERRENRLERQGELNKAKNGEVTPTEFFNYYLGYLSNPAIKQHFHPVNEATSIADGGRQWGMNVAVEDLHVVIENAKALGGKVVLGGHSLGGSVVTAYATWDFAGKPGAEGLSGLVYDDGASNPAAVTAKKAEESLAKLSKTTPWLAFGGIPSPTLGLFSAVGSTLAVVAPNTLSALQGWPLLPPFLQTKNSKGEVVPATNEAGFAYGVNVGTSPPNLLAAQVHAGQGLMEPAEAGAPWTWNGTGAITPIERYAEMLSGTGLKNTDGSEWYFPERLTIDTGAVGNGNANPAQEVLNVHSTMGADLPKTLKMLAIDTELGKEGVLKATELLAEQSGIPSTNLTLINEEHTYAHNDPAGGFPTNEFFSHVVPFLEGL
jgi:pimeloyl-ACP methyl ester carboxylesterase